MASPAYALNNEQFTFQIAGIEDRLAVSGFQGTEGLSETYWYEVEVVSESSALAIQDVVGLPCRLDIFNLEGELTRQVNGIVTRFEQGHAGRRFTHYTVEMEPLVKLLAHRHDCRMFQDTAVPDIVREVLDSAGIPSDRYRFAVGNYPPREYCVQYRESDLNFIARLMEDEGIFYFFEHGDDGETLIVADDASIHAPIAGDAAIHFHLGDGLIPDDHVRELRYGQAVVPGKVTLRDFNFKKPKLNMQVEKTADVHNELEVYDYPGKYEEPDVGDERKRVRLESIQAERVIATGESNCRRLVAGSTFELTEHAREAFNQQYLLTKVNHGGEQAAALEEDAGNGRNRYDARFTCMPAEQPFRAPRIARRPVVEGVQTAIVVGPSGEEIYTDEFGRVKVQFPWDRHGGFDEKSSCWIRVSQAWAGAGWGGMSIPRVGQEVIVDFLEGDPDRPIITGRVYHGENRPPYPLPEGKARMSIMSSSTKGGGGSNELRFDDTKESEELYLHAQKDETIQVGNDKNQTVGNNESSSVGNNRTKSVGVNENTTIGTDRTENVGSNETITIGANRTENVGANESVTIGGNRTEQVAVSENVSIGASQTTNIGGAASLTVGGVKTEQVALLSNEMVGAAKTLNVGAGYQIGVGGAMNTTVGLASMEQVGLTKHLKVGSKFVIECGSSKFTMDSGGKITLEGTQIALKASGPVKINGAIIDLN